MENLTRRTRSADTPLTAPRASTTRQQRGRTASRIRDRGWYVFKLEKFQDSPLCDLGLYGLS
jgi:hypothetical protein